MLRAVSELVSMIVRLREALEDRDLALAAELAQDLEELAERRIERREFTCPKCTLRFRWPGEVADHLALTHGVWSDEEPALQVAA